MFLRGTHFSGASARPKIRNRPSASISCTLSCAHSAPVTTSDDLSEPTYSSMGGETAYPSNWIWSFSFERGFDAIEGAGALQPWHYLTAASVCDWNEWRRFLTVTASRISKIVRTYVKEDFFRGNS